MDVCKNHPGRSARRRCFQCQDPMCPECQQHYDGHIFCSLRCRQAWRRRDRRERWAAAARKFAVNASPLLWWRYPPFRREQWARRAMVALWSVLAVQLATAAVLWQTVRLRPSRAAPAPAPIILAAAPPRWLEAPGIRDGLVYGLADGGDTGALLLRGGHVAAEIAPGQHYRLSDTPDRRPTMWSLIAKPDAGPREVWTAAEGVSGSVEQARDAGGIALTFDGGSTANLLPHILAVLRSRGVRATFFLTGEFIRRYPDAARSIVVAGHEVGNHTWSHPHLTTFERNGRQDTLPDLTRQRLQWELLRTENLFEQVTGVPMKALWRAPYGEMNGEILGWAAEIGYRHIGWTHQGGRDATLDTLDWVDDPASPIYVSGAAMADKIVTLAKQPRFRGGIVLMHVGAERRGDRVQDDLGSMIDHLRASSVPLRTVSDLLLSRS